jgi:hypothetical protein
LKNAGQPSGVCRIDLESRYGSPAKTIHFCDIDTLMIPGFKLRLLVAPLMLLALGNSLPLTCRAGSTPQLNPAVKTHAHEMQRALDARIMAVQDWQFQERAAQILAVVTAALGVLVGAVSLKVDGKPKDSSESSPKYSAWPVHAVRWMSITVGVITAITPFLFLADFRTLRKSISRANPIVESMANALDNYQIPDLLEQDRHEIQIDFYASVGRFDLLAQELTDQRTAAPTNTAAALERLLPRQISVHAQSTNEAPAWTKSEQTRDSTGVLFVGYGAAASLIVAESYSYQEAISRAASYFAGKDPSKANQLASIAAQFATKTNTWFSYDKVNSQYGYYTQIRVSNEIKNISLTAAAYKGSFGPITSYDISIQLPASSKSVAHYIQRLTSQRSPRHFEYFPDNPLYPSSAYPEERWLAFLARIDRPALEVIRVIQGKDTPQLLISGDCDKEKPGISIAGDLSSEVTIHCKATHLSTNADSGVFQTRADLLGTRLFIILAGNQYSSDIDIEKLDLQSITLKLTINYDAGTHDRFDLGICHVPGVPIQPRLYCTDISGKNLTRLPTP